MAHGLVKTEQNRKAVQHPKGGIIKTLLARDGDRAQAGQPLMELDNVVQNSSQRLLRKMAAYEATNAPGWPARSWK